MIILNWNLGKSTMPIIMPTYGTAPNIYGRWTSIDPKVNLRAPLLRSGLNPKLKIQSPKIFLGYRPHAGRNELAAIVTSEDVLNKLEQAFELEKEMEKVA